MKLFKKIFVLCSIFLFVFFSITGCDKKVKEAKCPFTTVEWGDSLAQVKELEGETSATEDNSYDGLSYLYPKTYHDLSGTIYYMFDDKEKLVSMLWLYEASNSDDAQKVYDEIHEDAEKTFGESGFEYNSEKFSEASIPADVWYLESGNVVISMFASSSFNSVQYQFMHPDVSAKDN